MAIIVKLIRPQPHYIVPQSQNCPRNKNIYECAVTLLRVCNNDINIGNHGYQTVMGHLWATGSVRKPVVSEH